MNGTTETKSRPLKIIIAGAGIGGLSAAVCLRQQGHHVSLYESSKFSTELGAAIHVAPNANGILKRMGISALETGANRTKMFLEYSLDGELVKTTSFEGLKDIWQHEWMLAHRAKLHAALRDAATDPSKPGPPAELHLSSAVADLDSLKATMTLKDGTVIQGDAIIGADGIHSVCRKKIPGCDKPVFPSGKNAVRFMIPREHALKDPATHKYATEHGRQVMWLHKNGRTIMYPTSDNTLLNFVCIHPQELTDASGGGWSNAISKARVLEIYQDHDEGFRALLSRADEASLKLWPLMDMEELPTWTENRLTLLGDAAHPFLPYQGQGGACAIEDAVALGVVLERGLSPEDVPERLMLYQEIRRERAERLREITRITGRDSKEVSQYAILQYIGYNFGYDEFDNSEQRLREWKWSRMPPAYKRMPTVFGPAPGPRQTFTGEPYNNAKSTFTTASIKIRTSRTRLQNMLPPGIKSWRFTFPGTLAVCSFSQTTLNNLDWLGGRGYKHVGLYIHGVEYEKTDGEKVKGSYLPILFENMADPITTGREELGMPKMFSSIDVERTDRSYHIRTSWEGTTWGEFQLEDLKPVETTDGVDTLPVNDDNENILTHRYIPQVGKDQKGQAEAEYACFVRAGAAENKPKVERSWTTKNAKFILNAGDWKSLPTMHHIVERLGEIPVYDVIEAKVVEGTGVSDFSGAARIE